MSEIESWRVFARATEDFVFRVRQLGRSTTSQSDVQTPSWSAFFFMRSRISSRTSDTIETDTIVRSARCIRALPVHAGNFYSMHFYDPLGQISGFTVRRVPINYPGGVSLVCRDYH